MYSGIKEGKKVEIADYYINDEVGRRAKATPTATILSEPRDSEELVMVQYTNGITDYVPQDVIEVLPFAKGGITKNNQIIEQFLDEETDNELRNISIHYSTLGDVMLLRNYGTLIAKRKGNKVSISNKRYSVTTSTIQNAIERMAKDRGMKVERISEDEFAKGGEVAEKETIVARYDINDTLSADAKYWKENKEEFIDEKMLDEEEAKEVDDDYIDRYIWGDEDAGYWIYDDLKEDLRMEFEDKLGKHVIVGGRNMGWRNLEGTKTFELDDTEQMMREIVPENTDFIYYLYKTDDNNYSAKVSHHDSPMGEHYELHIMPQKYVDEFYEKWENEEAGMENYDEDMIGEWYQEEVLSKKGMGGFLLGSALGGYAGYKIGRARPQKTGFSTEKKIAAQVKKEIKEMQKKRAQKKRAKSNIVDVEFEEIKARGGKVYYINAYNDRMDRAYKDMKAEGLDDYDSWQYIQDHGDFKPEEVAGYYLEMYEDNALSTWKANTAHKEQEDTIKKVSKILEKVNYAKGGNVSFKPYYSVVNDKTNRIYYRTEDERLAKLKQKEIQEISDDKIVIDKFNADGQGYSDYAKGGSIEEKKEAYLSSLGDELDIDIIYHADDLEDINSYDELEEKLSEAGAFDEDVIYYANAMKYLRDNDSSLNESLGLAADMGYECGNLNSEILASILKSQNNREDFYEKRGEIEEFFGE